MTNDGAGRVTPESEFREGRETEETGLPGEVWRAGGGAGVGRRGRGGQIWAWRGLVLWAWGGAGNVGVVRKYGSEESGDGGR